MITIRFISRVSKEWQFLKFNNEQDAYQVRDNLKENGYIYEVIHHIKV